MKTIAKRLIAAIAAMTMLIPSATVWAAKGETDVDIAAGKSAISAVYGSGGYNGNNVGNVTGSGLFISCASHTQTELVTIDLGARYPITQVSAYTYGNNTGTNSTNPNDFGFGSDAVFEFYASNTNPGQYTDLSTTDDGVKLNVVGDTQFVAVDGGDGSTGGGFNSHYELESVAAYRYVQLKYIKGTDAKADLWMGRINVWTTAEAAANVPTVVSAGKPVYSQFSNGYNHNFPAFNDGNENTTHWIYTSDVSAVAGFYDHIIDLEAKFPIEKVVVKKADSYGTVDGVMVSNDPTFTSSAPLSYDAAADEYYLNSALVPVFGTDFKYVKVQLTPTARPTDYSININEVSVYSTSTAAAAATAMADRAAIDAGKKTTAKDSSHYGDSYVFANVNDGDESTAWFTFANEPCITVDLGSAYSIESVRTLARGSVYGGNRNFDISKVEVTNDPNFNSDSVVTLSGSKYRIDNSGDTRYAFSENALPSEKGKYRYVRIYGDTSLYRDANNSAVSNGWFINEIEIYTNKDDASLKNVSLDSTATFINGGSVAGGSLEALLDGDSSTQCYSPIGMAVIKLPYPMTIEQIEVDSRPGYDSLTDNFTNLGGYNIWLSHEALTGDGAASMPAGTVKVSSAVRTDQTGERLYHAGATVVTEIEDENRYSYVTVQCPSNGEFYIYDVRILSNDIITGTNITNELTGEQANGEVLTLTTSWRSETAVSKTVNLYIARYDNGALTDVKMSEDKTLSGQVGSVSDTYTITDDVTAQTEFKGFVWEKGTLNPFA